MYDNQNPPQNNPNTGKFAFQRNSFAQGYTNSPAINASANPVGTNSNQAGIPTQTPIENHSDFLTTRAGLLSLMRTLMIASEEYARTSAMPNQTQAYQQIADIFHQFYSSAIDSETAFQQLQNIIK